MALLSLQALLGSLLLFLPLLPVHVHATAAWRSTLKFAVDGHGINVVRHNQHRSKFDGHGLHVVRHNQHRSKFDGHGLHVVRHKQHRPKFVACPWKHAHATFYEGGPGTFGGACGYDDVVKEGYGLDTRALSGTLFNNGQSCGSCYEIKCVDNPQWCKPEQPSLIVTGTDNCPPNLYQSADNGGWCNPTPEHFDIAKPAFIKIAEYKAGIVPVMYRRVPWKKQGGMKFTITGSEVDHRRHDSW